ncbi:MAG: zinc transporter [Myxococcota bacterium]|jgi:zinc transporter
MPKNPVLLAYKFKKSTQPIKLESDNITEALGGKDLCWVNLDARKHNIEEWLEKELSDLDSIIIESLTEDETRARLVEYENGCLIILRGVNSNRRSEMEDMVTLRIWVDEKRIITIQRRNIKAVTTIEEGIKNGKSYANAGEFICDICDELTDNIQPVIDKIEDSTDETEEQILEQLSNEDLYEDIVLNKKRIIIIKRHIFPQKNVIYNLSLCKQKWLGKNEKLHLQENANHILRYVEELDSLKERSNVVHDEAANAINRKLNKNMYFLAIIAAIFMPLTFISSLFGMNVGGIPLNVSKYGFWTISGTLLIMVLIQIFFSLRKIMNSSKKQSHHSL